LIIIAVGGMMGSFLLFLLVFAVLFKGGAEPSAEAAAQGQVPGSEAGTITTGRGVPGSPQVRRSGVDDVMLYSSEMEETIPVNPKIEGYNWAKWEMSVDTVLVGLRMEGISEVERYSPPDSDFANLVVLMPDEKRLKVEYRFYKNRLFHVEIYYSSYYQETVFNTFLFDMMRHFGKPYEITPSVDELGKVILHVKWDREDSLIELVSKPNGYYSLFLRNQEIIYQLEEARKSSERITAY